MRYSPRASSNKQDGFTLIEVLITMVIASFILILSTQFIVSATSYQGRQEITLPVQESVRGAMEVMSTELREAMTPRVISSYTSPPPALAAYPSSNTAITIVGGSDSRSFAIAKPALYPTVPGYNSQNLLFVDSPNIQGATCASVLNGGDYFLLLSQAAIGGTNLNISWGQVSPAGCIGSSVPALTSMPAIGQWTPDSRVFEATVTRYSLSTVNGVNVLNRQILVGTGAGTAQVVAFDISGMTLEYSVDGNTFASTPPSTAEPIAVRITLTGQTNQTRAGVSSTTPYILSQVVYMRQTALVKPF